MSTGTCALTILAYDITFQAVLMTAFICALVTGGVFGCMLGKAFSRER